MGMLGERETESFERLQFVLGAYFIGTVVGGWIYFFITGLLPAGNSIFTGALASWVFLAGDVALALVNRATVLRTAWLLNIARKLLEWTTPLGGASMSAYVSREVWHAVFAGLLVAGGIVVVRSTRWRLVALAALLAAVPIGYFLQKNWDDVTGRTTIMTRPS